MNKGSYLKLVALDVNGMDANIVQDKNVKNINEACNYFLENYKTHSTVVWLIFPCNYIIS